MLELVEQLRCFSGTSFEDRDGGLSGRASSNLCTHRASQVFPDPPKVRGARSPLEGNGGIVRTR